jgi:hypothetical protein
VAAYAEQMSAGAWRADSPQPIATDSDGLLIDGAHRLTAVILSGLPIVMPHAYDVPGDVFDVIDTGRRRDAYQFITGAQATGQAAAARWVLWYERRFHKAPIGGVAFGFPMHEVIAFAEAHGEALAGAVRAADIVYRGSGITRSTNAAVMLIVARMDIGADLEGWVDGLATGALLLDGDPRLALRARYSVLRRRPGQRITSQQDWSLIVLAMNAYLRGERLAKGYLILPPKDRWPKVGQGRVQMGQRARRRRARTAHDDDAR